MEVIESVLFSLGEDCKGKSAASNPVSTITRREVNEEKENRIGQSPGFGIVVPKYSKPKRSLTNQTPTSSAYRLVDTYSLVMGPLAQRSLKQVNIGYRRS